ncbi:NAD(P)/FAD-dependent oxidoreductase [Geodermatophilus sp. CPCC 205761]|uniref:NAD(P)/FAD-dependent oxidoreductase n=1 Tax=Geodermatophilus sp. CPCC 205761 TaxID=2936597 RepID=UPI003EEE09D9
MPSTWDAVVVGGGPAGSATALRLAATGRSVAVLERSRFDRPRVGETLAPLVWPLLEDLGVWERFTGLHPLPSWGTRSVWADPAPVEHSHLVSGYACGWHVDRRAFDRMLADAAASAGAHLWTGTAAVGCRPDGDAWLLACADGRAVRGRLVVDATGRRAGISRALGAGRSTFDRLVALAVRWDGVDVAEEQYLLLEAAAEGWWYTAPLPGAGMVGMLMTDADLCREGGLHASAPWRDRLSATAVTAARVGAAPLRSAPRAHSAASQRSRRAGDPRPWLSVGDAALSVDPLTGSGVLRALRTAESAADAAGHLLDRPGSAGTVVARYESARDDECARYLADHARHYGDVRRFATPFWRRRRPRRRPDPVRSDPSAPGATMWCREQVDEEDDGAGDLR